MVNPEQSSDDLAPAAQPRAAAKQSQVQAHIQCSVLSVACNQDPLEHPPVTDVPEPIPQSRIDIPLVTGGERVNPERAVQRLFNRSCDITTVALAYVRPIDVHSVADLEVSNMLGDNRATSLDPIEEQDMAVVFYCCKPKSTILVARLQYLL